MEYVYYMSASYIYSILWGHGLRGYGLCILGVGLIFFLCILWGHGVCILGVGKIFFLCIQWGNGVSIIGIGKVYL